MKFCISFNLSLCARYFLLIGSQLTTWSQGNLHYIRLHFFQLDREFFCLLPSLARLYSAAASPSERLRSDGEACCGEACWQLEWLKEGASHIDSEKNQSQQSNYNAIDLH